MSGESQSQTASSRWASLNALRRGFLNPAVLQKIASGRTGKNQHAHLGRLQAPQSNSFIDNCYVMLRSGDDEANEDNINNDDENEEVVKADEESREHEAEVENRLCSMSTSCSRRSVTVVDDDDVVLVGADEEENIGCSAAKMPSERERVQQDAESSICGVEEKENENRDDADDGNAGLLRDVDVAEQPRKVKAEVDDVPDHETDTIKPKTDDAGGPTAPVVSAIGFSEFLKQLFPRNFFLLHCRRHVIVKIRRRMSDSPTSTSSTSLSTASSLVLEHERTCSRTEKIKSVCSGSAAEILSLSGAPLSGAEENAGAVDVESTLSFVDESHLRRIKLRLPSFYAQTSEEGEIEKKLPGESESSEPNEIPAKTAEQQNEIPACDVGSSLTSSGDPPYPFEFTAFRCVLDEHDRTCGLKKDTTSTSRYEVDKTSDAACGTPPGSKASALEDGSTPVTEVDHDRQPGSHIKKELDAPDQEEDASEADGRAGFADEALSTTIAEWKSFFASDKDFYYLELLHIDEEWMVGRELDIFEYHNRSALNCCERTHFFPGAAVADVLLLPAFLKTELKSREADAQKSKRCGWYNQGQGGAVAVENDSAAMVKRRSFLPGLEAARKQWQRDINKQRNRKKKAAKKFKKSLDEEIEALWARQQLHDEKYFQLMDFRLPADTDETNARVDFDFRIQRRQKQLDEDHHEQHLHGPQQGLQQQPLLPVDGEAVAFPADHHVVQDDCQHEASEEGRPSPPAVITGTSNSKAKGGKGYYGGSYYKNSSYGYGHGAYHQMKHSGKKSNWLDSISKGTGRGVGTNWINTKGKAGAGAAAAAATPTAVPPPAPPAPVDLEAVVKELHAIPGVAENLTNPTFASKVLEELVLLQHRQGRHHQQMEQGRAAHSLGGASGALLSPPAAVAGAGTEIDLQSLLFTQEILAQQQHQVINFVNPLLPPPPPPPPAVGGAAGGVPVRNSSASASASTTPLLRASGVEDLGAERDLHQTPSTTDHSEVFEQTPPEVAVAVSGAEIGNGSSCAADVGRTLSFGETSEGAVVEEAPMPIREKKESEPVQAEDRAGDEDMDKEKESESLQEIATQKAAGAGPCISDAEGVGGNGKGVSDARAADAQLLRAPPPKRVTAASKNAPAVPFFRDSADFAKLLPPPGDALATSGRGSLVAPAMGAAAASSPWHEEYNLKMIMLASASGQLHDLPDPAATALPGPGPVVDPLHFYTRESQPMEDIMGVPFLGGTCAHDFGIGGVAAGTAYSGYGYGYGGFGFGGAGTQHITSSGAQSQGPFVEEVDPAAAVVPPMMGHGGGVLGDINGAGVLGLGLTAPQMALPTFSGAAAFADSASSENTVMYQ